MADKTTSQVWVFGDARNHVLFEMSLRVLAKARKLVDDTEGGTAMVLINGSGESREGPTECLDLEQACDDAVAHGADMVYFLESAGLAAVRADTYSEALAQVIRGRSPWLMLFALTDFGRDLAARTARILSAGLIADCTDLCSSNDNVIATCPAWSGEVVAEITFADGHGTGLATVRPQGLATVECKGVPGKIERIVVNGIEASPGARLLSSSPDPAEHRKLEEAELVVAGGAGLANVEGFHKARQLAAALGGEVGATRPAVLSHWVSEERMIGQTGKTVHPRLLLTAGVSGAIQFTAGIMDAETIIAVNRDPKAPIFEFADVGIVADAGALLPLLTDKVRRTRMRSLADVLCDEGTDSDEARTGFGYKMRALRKAQGLSTEALAQSTGKDPDFISRVENGEVTPSVSFLLGVGKAFGIDPSTFLTDEAKVEIREQRLQTQSTRTDNYSYETLTPGAEDEHLRGFMITIEPRQAHKPVAYKHEGEEFVYVLEGELELTLAAKTHHLKPGESRHFNSDVPHKLKSLSDEPTRCLVMLYTP